MPAGYTPSSPPDTFGIPLLHGHFPRNDFGSLSEVFWLPVVLCQEKVQIKCNQFSLFLTKSNLLFLLHSPRCFQDIVPHIHLETNIHNDCEYALYCKMFRCTQKSVYMHVHN